MKLSNRSPYDGKSSSNNMKKKSGHSKKLSNNSSTNIVGGDLSASAFSSAGATFGQQQAPSSSSNSNASVNSSNSNNNYKKNFKSVKKSYNATKLSKEVHTHQHHDPTSHMSDTTKDFESFKKDYELRKNEMKLAEEARLRKKNALKEDENDTLLLSEKLYSRINYQKDYENLEIFANEDPCRIQFNLLKQIIESNGNTFLGKATGLLNCENAEDFRRIMPLTTWQDYEKVIERMMRGEPNIMTTNNIVFYAESSNEKSKGKHVPVTEVQVEHALKKAALTETCTRRYVEEILQEKSGEGKAILLGSTKKNFPKITTGIPKGSLSAFMMDQIGGSLLENIATAPRETYTIRNKDSALYIQALFALSTNWKEVTSIRAMYSHEILALVRLIEHKHKDLCRDMINGQINEEIILSEMERTHLQEQFEKNPSRAQELKNIFSDGFFEIIPRIFPNVLYCSGISTGSYSHYTDLLRPFLGSVQLITPGYACSECLSLAPNLNPELPYYTLMPDVAFLEFIPVSKTDLENPSEVLRLHEIVEGGTYELVITTFAGFTRYRMGDVVKVVNYFGNLPCIEFLYKRNQAISITTEKTTEQMLTSCALNLSDDLDIDMHDFAFRADYSLDPPAYTLYVERKRGKEWEPEGRFNNPANLLEKYLIKANPAYGEVRDNSLTLGAPVLKFVEEGTFESYQKLLKTKERDPSHGGLHETNLKLPKVISRGDIVQLFEENELCSFRYFETRF